MSSLHRFILRHCSSNACDPKFSIHKYKIKPKISSPITNTIFKLSKQIKNKMSSEESPIISTSSSSSSSSSSFSSKLSFFIRLRKLFNQSIKCRKEQSLYLPHTSEEQDSNLESDETKDDKNETISMVELQRAVKNVLFGKWEEREKGVVDIGKLAAMDVKTRKVLVELGVVPPLVDMVDSGEVSRRSLAVHALVQLAQGTFTNKALILEAGILSKLPKNIDQVDESTQHDFSQLVFSISSLCKTHIHLNLTQLLPFLLTILQSKSTSNKSKEACIGTMYNLSTMLENSGPLISNQVVDILLSLLYPSTSEITEKALATLGNLVVTLMGKNALEDRAIVPEVLIDVLTWENKPKCQELSAYILMILAHQSSEQREKMVKSGIVHVLLEVALLGTPLAQKRALKLLQWFKDERQAKVGPHSGPQTRRLVPMGSPVTERETSEGKILLKKMVNQSLYKNMEVITRRANDIGESSKVKSLIINSSSKSLPY